MRNKTIPYAFIILMLLSIELFLCPFSYIEGSTNVGGPIVGDITWKLAGSPYIAVAPVLIMEGATLRIEPGVTVMFNAGNSIQVDGTLVAIGKEGKMITFTSSADPTPGFWGAVRFTDKSEDVEFAEGQYDSGCILEYCLIEYAGGSQSAALVIEKSFPYISHCIIQDNFMRGVYINNSSEKQLSINYCTISKNKSSVSIQGAGIYITGDVWINNSVISEK